MPQTLWRALCVFLWLVPPGILLAQPTTPILEQGTEIESQPTPNPEALITPLPANFSSSFQILPYSDLSGRIVFTSKIDDIDRLLVLDLDSKRISKLVEGPGNSSYPSWSPDGSLIAFTSDRDGNKEIYVADWEGGNQQRLTNNQSVDDNPSWSSDGKRVFFYAEGAEGESQTNIFSVAPGDLQPTRITNFKGKNSTPRASPSGNSVAYSTNRFWPGWDICALDLSSKSETCPLKGVESYCRPDWSPSGALIAYSIGILNDIDIGVYNTSDQTKTVLTTLPLREYDATWSPKGDRIAFTAENGIKDQFNVYVVPFGTPKAEPKPLLKSVHPIRFLSWTATKTIDLEVKRLKELPTPTETPTAAPTNAIISAQPTKAESSSSAGPLLLPSTE